MCIADARLSAMVAGLIGERIGKRLSKMSSRGPKSGRRTAGLSGQQAGEGGLELTAAPTIGSDTAYVGRMKRAS